MGLFFFFYPDGEDFIGLSSLTLEFFAGSVSGDTGCTNITIIDDDTFEKDHSFSVNLESNGIGDVVITGPAIVTIQDNESKLPIGNLIKQHLCVYHRVEVARNLEYKIAK